TRQDRVLAVDLSEDHPAVGKITDRDSAPEIALGGTAHLWTVLPYLLPSGALLKPNGCQSPGRGTGTWKADKKGAVRGPEPRSEIAHKRGPLDKWIIEGPGE